MTKTDSVFLKHFSQLLAGLVLFTLILILYSIYAHGKFYADPKRGIGAERERTERQLVQARIGPVAGVYAGETGRAAQAEAMRLALEAAKAQVAYEGTLDGAVIYGKLCGACHTAAVGGAPAMTVAAWAPRVAQGNEVLIAHAIQGYDGPGEGIMPARGGNPSLTDEQVGVTVQWMLTQLK